MGAKSTAIASSPTADIVHSFPDVRYVPLHIALNAQKIHQEALGLTLRPPTQMFVLREQHVTFRATFRADLLLAPGVDVHKSK